MTDDDGILSDTQIAALFEQGQLVAGRDLDEDQIQPASLDLRLGAKAYRVRASFLPGSSARVADKLSRFALHEFDLSQGAVLETGCVYIVPLLESLHLPAAIAASANPKSSTGRLDIFTRVITDQARQFDMVGAGYEGPLYLEISPRTFPVLVRTGSRLSQIRFRQGDAVLTREELQTLHNEQTLIAPQSSDLKANAPSIETRGISMSIDLTGDENGLIGYRGKRHTGVVDVDRKAACPVLDYWEPIYNHATAQGSPSTLPGEIVLDPDEFYILVSREAVHVPPDFAAEMVPFDPLVGEFRVHYAGFFDPGFGHAAAGGKGARAVLEVRSHEVPFILEHGQTVGRLLYEHMAQRPSALYGADLKSNYQAQGLKLSKHFC